MNYNIKIEIMRYKLFLNRSISTGLRKFGFLSWHFEKKQFTIDEFKQINAVYVTINYAVNVNINYKTNRINNVYYTKFLGLTLDVTLSWKPHIDQLISKRNSARYVIRSLKSIISLENLRTIYFSSVHPIISYRTIFRGNSTYSNTIFKLQKRVITINVNAGNRILPWALQKIKHSTPVLTVHILLITLRS